MTGSFDWLFGNSRFGKKPQSSFQPVGSRGPERICASTADLKGYQPNWSMHISSVCPGVA